MAQLSPSLTFNGNCREAMKFYERCFGGELQMSTFGEAPGEQSSPAVKDKIMHAHLKAGELVLMPLQDTF